MRQKFAFWTASLPLCTLVVAISCSTVPDNGRRQLTAFESDARRAELEQRGHDEFEKLKEEKPVSVDPELNAVVQRVGQRLAHVVPVPNARWEFVIFEDPTPNAFALPGGKVGVHTGLFQVTQNDAGLAAVVGHELAHVVANHAGERLVGQALSAEGGGILGRRNGARGRFLASRRNSREQELEADRIGAVYMARAGYEPGEAVELWRRFAAYKVEHGSRQGPAFLSTHPLDEQRIASLLEFLPQAQAQFQPQPQPQLPPSPQPPSPPPAAVVPTN